MPLKLGSATFNSLLQDIEWPNTQLRLLLLLLLLRLLLQYVVQHAAILCSPRCLQRTCPMVLPV